MVATADDGRQLRIGGTAEHAIAMGDDLDRNAELAMAICNDVTPSQRDPGLAARERLGLEQTREPRQRKSRFLGLGLWTPQLSDQRVVTISHPNLDQPCLTGWQVFGTRSNLFCSKTINIEPGVTDWIDHCIAPCR